MNFLLLLGKLKIYYMKKLILSITAICTAITLNAQQNLVNGDFEGAMTATPYVNTYTTAGWVALLNGGPETTAPAQGAQSAKLVTAVDAPLNAQTSWGSDTIPGVAQQTYSGAFTDVANMTISFQYKATIVGSDIAFIQVVVYDTLLAGATDNVALYFDNIEVDANVAQWTPLTFTMNNAGGTGTANNMQFIAVSSIGGYFNDPTVPELGTTLWIDDIQIAAATSGIEENVISTSVYPNPATDVLNIVSSEEIANVTIVSLDGKIVATTTNSTVDVSQLISGMYVYEVKTTSGTITRNTFMKK